MSGFEYSFDSIAKTFVKVPSADVFFDSTPLRFTIPNSVDPPDPVANADGEVTLQGIGVHCQRVDLLIAPAQ